MSDMNGLSIDGAAEKALSILGDDDAPSAPTPVENLSDKGKAERIASEPEPEAEVAPEGEVEASEPEVEAETPIDPPVSWKADAKEKFKALPRELQQIVVERESERDRHFGKSAQEAADIKKAAEADRLAVQNERQAYTNRLNELITMAQTMDPVLAEGAKTDWAKLAQEDPIGAFQKREAYNQRLQQVNGLTQQRDQIQKQIQAEQLRQADTKLTEALGEGWTNTDKRAAFQSDIKSILEKHGYSPEEYAQVTDARAILVAHKAALYDKLMAQQSKIADAKKTPQPAAKVLKSQASNDGSDKSSRVAQALNRASKLSRTDDIAALVASVLE